MTAGQTSIYFTFFMNLILQGSLQQLLAALKKLQIMVHTMLINVTIPANASIFFGFLLNILAFDVIPLDDTFDSWF